MLNYDNQNLRDLDFISPEAEYISARNNDLKDLSILSTLPKLVYIDLEGNQNIDLERLPLINSSGKVIKMKLNSDLITKYQQMEDILVPNNARFTFFPIKYVATWELYKKALASFWTSSEIHLSVDINHWNERLTDDERKFIKNVLAFFAASDGIVTENLAAKFYNEVQIAEARAFYSFQMAIETIHSEVYSLLIDTYVIDKEEKNKLFTAIDNIGAIQQKANWALKWMNSNRSFAERLIAFACVEGIHFSSSFCAIFWLAKRGLMPGLTHSNELISRDENLHCLFAVHLFGLIKNKPSKETIMEIITSAVEVEKSFVRESLAVDLIGLNSKLMIQYVEYVADMLIHQFLGIYHYKVEKPFDWVTLGLEGMTSFFERKVSEYSRPTDTKLEYDSDCDV